MHELEPVSQAANLVSYPVKGEANNVTFKGEPSKYIRL